MSQLEVAYAEQITTETGTLSATYLTLTNPTIAAGVLVPGKKSLLLVRGECQIDAVSATGATKFRHGSTDFVGSEIVYTNSAASGGQNDTHQYFYMTVWTAVSGEALTVLQRGDGTNYGRNRFTTITALRLTDNFTENTDWYFNENTTNQTLTTSNQTGATVTFTPATAGQRWLVISDARIEAEASDNYIGRLDETGGAVAGWEIFRPGRATGDAHSFPHLWSGTLGAVSQTFRHQSRRSAVNAPVGSRHTRSAVFALNVNSLDVVSVSQSDAAVTLTNVDGNYGKTVNTVAHAQAVASGNVLVLGYAELDINSATSPQPYFSPRVRIDGVDAYSTDGVTQTYTLASGISRRWLTPQPGTTQSVQSFPHFHINVQALASGSRTINHDVGISAGTTRRTLNHRLIALSLDSTPPAPPAGAGGSPVGERNEQKMYLLDPDATRRRVMIRLVDATDNVTPEIAEAGGQPAVAINGGVFTTTNVGVLVAQDASNGLYYADVGQLNLSAIGSLRVRFKSAATALFTTTLAVEPLSLLYVGTATGGGANYADLGSPPAYVQPGSIVRIVGGTGAGQSMLVLSYASPRVTTEANWDTPPAAGSTVIIEPGLPFVIPDANVALINKSALAAVGLQEGAEAVQPYLVRTGANSTTQLVTSLPVTVGGIATAPNFWVNRAIIFKTGGLAGDTANITASVVSGADTIITVDILTATPAVGAKFVLT